MTQIFSETLPDTANRARYLRVGLAYGLIWLITWYSARLVAQIGGASLWFLPGGLRYAVLFFLGWRGVLLELVTVWLVSAIDLMGSGKSFPALISVQMAWLNFQWLSPVVGYALVLLPLRAWLQRNLDFKRPLHTSVFLTSALACAALAALGGSFGLTRIGVIDVAQWSSVWRSWLVGDFVGIVTLSPLLLVLAGKLLTRYLDGASWADDRPVGPMVVRYGMPTVLIAVASLLWVFALAAVLNLTVDLPFLLLLLLVPLAGLAISYGLRSAVLTVVLLDSGLVLLIAVMGQGDAALRFQLVMMAIALVGLWLGGVVDARRSTLQRYRDFSYASNDLLWEADAQGRVVSVLGRLAEHIALPMGRHWRTLLAGAEPAQIDAIESHWRDQRPFRHLEVTVPFAGRATRWIALNGQPAWNDDGEWIGYRGTAVDVSKARRARAMLRSYNQQLQDQVTARTLELENSQRHLQVVLAAAPVGMMELDAQGRCRYINDMAAALIGFTHEQAQGRSLLDFVHLEDRRQVQEALQAQWLSAGVQGLECRLAQTQRWCALRWIHVNQADAGARASVLVLTDATARRQHEAQLWSLAHHDALTKLPNRSLFADRCAQALSLAKRNHAGAAVLWVDLDGFKAVNDTMGHAAGDQLLVQVAQRLQSRAREADTVARMGGDEFALVLAGIGDVTQADKLAAEIVTSLAQPYDLEVGRARVTASVGVALYPWDAQTVDDLIRCADLAMYSAKRGGKNKEQNWRDSGLAPLG